MGEGSAGVVWFAAPGFRLISIDDAEIDVVVKIETDAERVGCRSCGVIAKSKDRRWVTLRDAPAGERPVTLRWWKRVWEYKEPACVVKSWTEQRSDLALPRHSLTERVGRWAADRVAAIEATPASLARELGVTWATGWAVIARHGQARLDGVDQAASVEVGFDETAMSPAKRNRRRRFITAAVDIADGRIISGRDALQAKLINGLGQIEDAYEKARVLGKAPSASVVRYESRMKLGKLLRFFGGESEHAQVQLNLTESFLPKLEVGKLYMLPSFYAPY